MISKETLLGSLPPYQNKKILLVKDQTVHHIINEVLQGHKDFAKDYDKIALFFDSENIDDLSDQLFRFCKENLEYIEESEDEQTVLSPAAMLTRGHCDCKGYSSFIGGILDALNRQGMKIDWCYRFASYNVFNDLPHHVFIVVKDPGGEIWIDPTPGSNKKTPVWYIDKKVKTMPLYKISGTNTTSNNNHAAQMIWENNRWVYVLPTGARIGDFFEDLMDLGSQTSSDSADAVLPGFGSIIEGVSNWFKNLFGFGSDPAQQKIWFMYQIPKTNPTQAEVKKALDKAKADANWPHTGDWLEAYTNIVQAYQAIYDLLVIRDNLRAKRGIIGYTSPTGIRINDSDVFVRVSDPQTGPGDLNTIVNNLKTEIMQLQQPSGGGGGGSIIPAGLGGNNLLLLAGAGFAVYYFTKKRRSVNGLSSKNVLMIGGAGLLLYLLMKPKNQVVPVNDNQVPTENTNPQTENNILPGDINSEETPVIRDPEPVDQITILPYPVEDTTDSLSDYGGRNTYTDGNVFLNDFNYL